MKAPASPAPSRRRLIIGLGLMLTGIPLAACAPQPPPAPGSWAEEYYRRQAKYREWGQGRSTK